MARRSEIFSSMPQNSVARKRIYKEARTGRRKIPMPADIGDALHTITAAQRYREWFVEMQPSIDFLRVLSESWSARKDWRP
jgi:hypothetical protein